MNRIPAGGTPTQQEKKRNQRVHKGKTSPTHLRPSSILTQGIRFHKREELDEGDLGGGQGQGWTWPKGPTPPAAGQMKVEMAVWT